MLVAGRHAGVRGHLSHLLRAMPEVANVREADAAQTLLAFCRAAECDAVVVDATLPVDGDAALITLIQQARRGTAVIVHSFALEYAAVQQCLRLGAQGFLAAEDLSDELVLAVRAVLAGGTYLSQTVRLLLRDGPGEGAA